MDGPDPNTVIFIYVQLIISSVMLEMVDIYHLVLYFINYQNVKNFINKISF